MVSRFFLPQTEWSLGICSKFGELLKRVSEREGESTNQVYLKFSQFMVNTDSVVLVTGMIICPLLISWASLMAQWWRTHLPMSGTQVWSLGWEDSLEKKPTPVFLLGKVHRQKSPSGYSPWGHRRVGHNLVIKQQWQQPPGLLALRLFSLPFFLQISPPLLSNISLTLVLLPWQSASTCVATLFPLSIQSFLPIFSFPSNILFDNGFPSFKKKERKEKRTHLWHSHILVFYKLEKKIYIININSQ